MGESWKKEVVEVIILSAIYIILGNARSIQPNPFIPGAAIAVNMIVPIIAGILFGRYVGLATGIIGTTLNMFTPAGTIYEALAIAPHGIMGFVAGYLRNRLAMPFIACSIIIGHALNMTAFILYNLVPLATVYTAKFWYGFSYEVLVEVIAIIIIVTIYKATFEK